MKKFILILIILQAILIIYYIFAEDIFWISFNVVGLVINLLTYKNARD